MNMEVADMDFYLIQSLIEEFINIYNQQLDELVNYVLEIKKLDDGILKEHWSGEGRDAFTTKINEWADNFKNLTSMMKTTEKAVATLDKDADTLLTLISFIKITN